MYLILLLTGNRGIYEKLYLSLNINISKAKKDPSLMERFLRMIGFGEKTPQQPRFEYKQGGIATLGKV